MKTLTDWLLAQRQRLVIVAIVTAPLLPFVTAPLLGLETVRRGALQGFVSAVFGVAGLSLLAVLSRTGVVGFAMLGVVTMGVGVAVGALIRWAGNLVLSFQVVWLVCFVAVLAFGAFGPDPVVAFGPLMAGVKEMLLGQALTDAQVDEVLVRLARELPASMLMLVFVGTLLITYWWSSVASGEPRFGAEFRQLKLGRWLGSTATVVLALGLVFGAPLVQTLLPMALLGFLVQGFAVAHAWVHAKKWNPALLGVLYVLLVLPPVTVAVTVVGLVDNWLSLRKPMGSAV